MLHEKLLCWLFAYCLFALFPPFIELLCISAGWKPANYFSRRPVSWLLVRFCQWEALIGVWKTKGERRPDPSRSQLQEMPPRVAWQRAGEKLLFRPCCPFPQQKWQYLQWDWHWRMLLGLFLHWWYISNSVRAVVSTGSEEDYRFFG